MLLKGLQIPKTTVLINESVLKVSTRLGCFRSRSAYQTGARDKFDVDLDALARILHLLIGFRRILGIWQFYSHLACCFQHFQQAGDRTTIAFPSQLHPEHDDTGIRIAATHIADLFQFGLGMLIRMMVRPPGLILERAEVTVIAFHPFVDRRTGNIVASRCLRDPISLGVFNYCLPSLEGLC